MKYQHKDRKTVASNQRFNVYFDSIELSDGSSLLDFLVISPRARTEDGVVGVTVLPIYQDKIGLMRVWRHQFSKYMWQAPAGFVETGASAEETAKRELFEETGFFTKKLTNLGRFCTDAGLVDGYINIFIATGLIKEEERIDQEVGVAVVNWLSSQELCELLVSKPEDFGVSTYLACKFFLENKCE